MLDFFYRFWGSYWSNQFWLQYSGGSSIKLMEITENENGQVCSGRGFQTLHTMQIPVTNHLLSCCLKTLESPQQLHPSPTSLVISLLFLITPLKTSSASGSAYGYKTQLLSKYNIVQERCVMWTSLPEKRIVSEQWAQVAKILQKLRHSVFMASEAVVFTYAVGYMLTS